jgi:hypothetical protein
MFKMSVARFIRDLNVIKYFLYVCRGDVSLRRKFKARPSRLLSTVGVHMID